MKFAFVGQPTTRMVGERKTSATKALRMDLAETLIMLASEWAKDPAPLNEAKASVLGCLEQAECEGAKAQEVLRMKANVGSIDSMDEIIKYCYNYMLRSSGLAVFKRV